MFFLKLRISLRHLGRWHSFFKKCPWDCISAHLLLHYCFILFRLDMVEVGSFPLVDPLSAIIRCFHLYSKVYMRLRRKWESPVSYSANKPTLFIQKRKVDLLSQLIGNWLRTDFIVSNGSFEADWDYMKKYSKMRLCLFKHNFGTKLYLLQNSLNIKQRSYLSQLRIGILQINIEIGRYRSIPLEERLCRLCNMNEIEDEIHFLFRCPTYNVQHNIWFTTM